MADKDARDPKDPKEPKANTPADREKQAVKLVLKQLKKSRPEFTENDIEVVWTQMSRGDGDWRALILVHRVEDTLYSVGFNYETEDLYVDEYLQGRRHR